MHVIRLATPVKSHSNKHHALHWTLKIKDTHVHKNMRVVFKKNSIYSASIKEHVRKLSTDINLDRSSRNKNCKMCGVYEVEDWRKLVLGSKENYPLRYLRIESPQDQIFTHFPRNCKMCAIKTGHSTNACIEMFNVEDIKKNYFHTDNVESPTTTVIHGNHAHIHQSDVRWMNFTKDY